MTPRIRKIPNKNRVIIPLLKEGIALQWNVLWLPVFGLLAIMISLSSFWQGAVDIGHLSDDALRAVHILRATFTPGVQQGGMTLATIVTFAILFGALFLLGSIGQAAIIDTTQKARQGIATNFRASWVVGRRAAVKLLVMHITLRVTMFLLTTGLGLLLFVLPHTGFLSTLATIVVIALLLCAALAFSFMSVYMANLLVTQGYSFAEAWNGALRLTRTHWLLSFEIALLFLFMEILVGFLWIILSALLFVPFMLLAILFTGLHIFTSIDLLLNLWLTVIIFSLALIAAIYTAWSNAVWSLLFFDLREEKSMRAWMARSWDRLRT